MCSLRHCLRLHADKLIAYGLMAVQAYYGNLNAHACQRYGFLQAQERYKERPNKNPLAGMVFRQVSYPTTPACHPYHHAVCYLRLFYTPYYPVHSSSTFLFPSPHSCLYAYILTLYVLRAQGGPRHKSVHVRSNH